MDFVDDDMQALLAEQRLELISAIAVESDLNYAYQLQLQEAITASLPQSEASSSAPPLPVIEDLGFSPSIAQLLADEIDKYEQVVSDRVLVEHETKQMCQNFDRLIYDQAFAREIVDVPEVEWKNTGDWIEKPYGEGSPSSAASSSSSGGSFRVYVKGLVRQEKDEEVGDVKMTGIGVVICDSSGCPLMELRKSWDDLAEDEKTEDIVEVKALIEGLSLAVSLGLRRINIFLDHNSLYQLVKGKGLPTENKIMTFFDEVNSLQRKFASCSVSLVEEKEIRLAYELARDAIVSKAKKHGKNLKETCTICTEDIDIAEIHSIDSCLHQYCFSCMKRHVEYKLLQGNLPKCPHEGCETELKTESCRNFLTLEMYDILSQRKKEAAIPTTEKIYCPYPKCSELMSKSEVQRFAIHLPQDAYQVGARKCTKCHKLFCINCKVPWHVNLTCFDYKMQNPPPAEDAKLKTLASSKNWRQCPKCNRIIELAEGCYHIYCRCKHEFCYTCGAEWKNKKATCTCPLWDVRNLLYAQRNEGVQRR